MQTLIVKTETLENANFLASFLRNVKTVKSVTIELNNKKALRNHKIKLAETEPYNWVNPSRPATDKEFEEMIAEAENGPFLTTKELRSAVTKHVKKCNV